MLKWLEGRQNTGYEKLKIFESKLLKMDCYLLRMREGSYIDFHLDEVEGYEHYRLNVILKKAEYGGEFFVRGPSGYPRLIRNRVNYFFPDTMEHGVTKVKRGTRYVLSIGWLR